MPRLRVIVLSQDAITSAYNVLFWADVPTSRQPFYANIQTTSAWPGATATDNTNLANGSVVEQGSSHAFPAGTTLVQAEAYLQTQWQNYQTYITGYNPWSRYGSTWDGTTWVLSGAT